MDQVYLPTFWLVITRLILSCAIDEHRVSVQTLRVNRVVQHHLVIHSCCYVNFIFIRWRTVQRQTGNEGRERQRPAAGMKEGTLWLRGYQDPLLTSFSILRGFCKSNQWSYRQNDGSRRYIPNLLLNADYTISAQWWLHPTDMGNKNGCDHCSLHPRCHSGRQSMQHVRGLITSRQKDLLVWQLQHPWVHVQLSVWKRNNVLTATIWLSLWGQEHHTKLIIYGSNVTLCTQ